MLARHAPIVADVNGETLTLYVLVFCVLPPQVANRPAYCYAKHDSTITEICQ
jgi:hypothetical protein